MLIDWLTLRFPIDDRLGPVLHEKIIKAMGRVVSINPKGEIQWEKIQPDWESIRSDSSGLFWSITADGESRRYLTIGGSPASLDYNGINVFGSLNVGECANVLILFASRALGCVLPHWKLWDCRRMDITCNYDMGSPAQVKEALRSLLSTDAPRRRSNSDSRGGDTVYWNYTSDLQCGKAYHKGPQLRMKVRKGEIVLDEFFLALTDNLLRLELKLGARWFRRMIKDWRTLTPDSLLKIHQQYFDRLIGDKDVEVFDMENLLLELEKVAPTKGRALAAHRTWALIKTLGYSLAKDSMPRSTWNLHGKYLRAAGVSSADLCAGKILEFRKRQLVLDQPVTGWSQIRKTA